MSTVDLSHYKNLYLSTSREQLQKMKEGIALLSSQSDSKEGIDAVYINAHTLVSKSMMMGYTQIASLCKDIEAVFYTVREKKLLVSLDLLDALSQSVIGISQAFESIEHENKEIDLSSSIEKIKKYES